VPIQDDAHFHTVIRYVEANPLRAGLVGRAEDWAWSSLGAMRTPWAHLVAAGLVARTPEWVEWVNRPATDETLRIRAAVARGAPFGASAWVDDTAERLGLQFTLRPRGRPRRDPGVVSRQVVEIRRAVP
jgi:putative transposase